MGLNRRVFNNTKDSGRSDTGKNFRIKHQKTTRARLIQYLSPDTQLFTIASAMAICGMLEEER